MKKFIVLLLILLPLGVVAQELKIAVVNAGEIFTMMPEYSDVEMQTAALNEQYEKEFKVMQDEYNKKFAEYVEQRDSLTDNIRLRREQEIQDLENRIQNFVPVAQQEMQKKQQELLAPIQEKLHNAIKAVGQEKGYTFILNPQVLLYQSDNAVDATPFVKAKLGLK